MNRDLLKKAYIAGFFVSRENFNGDDIVEYDRIILLLEKHFEKWARKQGG